MSSTATRGLGHLSTCQDVASIGECASVLREIPVLSEQMGPPPGGDGE
jgi:hypothetical protein